MIKISTATSTKTTTAEAAAGLKYINLVPNKATDQNEDSNHNSHDCDADHQGTVNKHTRHYHPYAWVRLHV